MKGAGVPPICGWLPCIFLKAGGLPQILSWGYPDALGLPDCRWPNFSYFCWLVPRIHCACNIDFNLEQDSVFLGAKVSNQNEKFLKDWGLLGWLDVKTGV